MKNNHNFLNVTSEHSCDYYLSFSHSSQSWVKWAHQSHRKIQPYVFVTKNRKTIFVMTLKNYAWFFWCCLCTRTWQRMVMLPTTKSAFVKGSKMVHSTKQVGHTVWIAMSMANYDYSCQDSEKNANKKYVLIRDPTRDDWMRPSVYYRLISE